MKKETITAKLRKWGFTPKQIKSVNNHLHYHGICFAHIEYMALYRLGDGIHIRSYTKFEDGMVYEYVFGK